MGLCVLVGKSTWTLALVYFRPQPQWEQSTPLVKHPRVGVPVVVTLLTYRVICRRRRWRGLLAIMSMMCFAPLSPGSPSLHSFTFPAAFHNIINTLHSTNRKIPAPSHFQVILCILIRSSREKFDNTLELGPSFPWLLPEN